MISRTVISHQYAWSIILLFDIKSSDTESLKNLIGEYDNAEEFIEKAHCGYKNTPLVIKDSDQGTSIIAITETTSSDEFLNIMQRSLIKVGFGISDTLGLDEREVVPDIVSKVTVMASALLLDYVK